MLLYILRINQKLYTFRQRSNNVLIKGLGTSFVSRSYYACHKPRIILIKRKYGLRDYSQNIDVHIGVSNLAQRSDRTIMRGKKLPK